jgi:hypothetical protein
MCHRIYTDVWNADLDAAQQAGALAEDQFPNLA